jgi:nitrous oxide reductase accessory protein NosL
MKLLHVVLVICVGILWQGQVLAVESALFSSITEQDRCPVCGMFVAKYPDWVAQVKLSDGNVAMFDGPKDMLVYYFAPAEYGAGEAAVVDIVVKDYYSQKWIDGRLAFYVTGSDVYGPMGHEFVPFDTREAADNFIKDHHGKMIWALNEITPDLVQSMRKGHKMKGHMKN